MLPHVLPLTSNLPLPLHKPQFLAVSLNQYPKSHMCFAVSPSNQNPDGDESRWLREEQRWLREEQRWLREESRWNAERQALLLELNNLKLRIQELERLNSVQGASVSETVSKIAKLLQVLKDGDFGKTVDRIADRTSAELLAVEAAQEEVEEEEEEEEVVIKEVVSIRADNQAVQKRATLRNGSEGEEVHAMQEALQKLGFYSGEEDIEFSSFSSGTERAVRTWQATIGVPEDGIMTAELLEILFGNPGSGIADTQEYKATDLEKGANGAPVAATTNISEVQKSVVTEDGATEVGMPEHRVYLLGENRWEEPSRLSRVKKPATRSKSGKATTKCLTCRGEGRLLCMECDGTGEPNVEPQFMEWIGEEAKCPYCEGLGYTTCDVCGGKTGN